MREKQPTKKKTQAYTRQRVSINFCRDLTSRDKSHSLPIKMIMKNSGKIILRNVNAHTESWVDEENKRKNRIKSHAASWSRTLRFIRRLRKACRHVSINSRRGANSCAVGMPVQIEERSC